MTTSLTEATTVRNQNFSPLLQLPGEIRNEIYAYAFQGTCLSVNPYSGKLANHKSSRGLMFACRQTSSEVKEVCMQHVVLRLPPLKDMFLFRRTVSVSALASIRRVRVSKHLAQYVLRASDHTNAVRMVFGSRLTSLELVEVCDDFSWLVSGQSLLVKHLVKATGNQSLRVRFVRCVACLFDNNRCAT